MVIFHRYVNVYQRVAMLRLRRTWKRNGRKPSKLPKRFASIALQMVQIHLILMYRDIV